VAGTAACKRSVACRWQSYKCMMHPWMHPRVDVKEKTLSAVAQMKAEY